MANFGDEKNLLKKENKEIDGLQNKTLHWFACLGDTEDSNNNNEERENNTTLHKDREEKIRLVREKQNEDRQRKLEELKAQALAAQKFREQKEEERKRRIDELKVKETDRRQQVEERKKAIWEAEKERREYILRKNQDRETRIDCKKKNERSSIVFAFGSSTPRLLNSTETITVSPSNFWNHRRSTSITNVAFSGNTLTRRSSERDLSDAPKKRATSASGLDRKNEDLRHMSRSMYEVFNWSSSKDERPNKRYSLAIGPPIDIDNPQTDIHRPYETHGRGKKGKDEIESSTISYRSVARRKTDLMPTVPSPRDRSFYGSRSSLGSLTPRTPGRAMSMTRLDQLAQPRRRNGEHICAIIEREKRALSSETNSNGTTNNTSPTTKNLSKSMTNLHGINSNSKSKSNFSKFVSNKNLHKTGASKSMLHLATKSGDRKPNLKIRNEIIVNRQKDEQPNSNNNDSGLRSGEITPGGSLTTTSTRPGSSMSNSICIGMIQRRTPRKPRPVSIAGTGVTNGVIGDVNTQKPEKPPLPKTLNKYPSVTKSPARSVDNVKHIEKRTSTPAKSSRLASANKTSSFTQSPLATPRSEKSPTVEKPPSPSQPITSEPVPVDNITQQFDLITISTEPNGPTEENNLIQIEELSSTVETNIDNVKIEQIIETIQTVEVKNIDETVNLIPNQEILIEPENKLLQDMNLLESVDMSASFMAKNRITTEEEAKAALAERRRLAREEAERQAELERLRIEEEEKLFYQKQLEEEEQQRRLEEEAHRLAQLQKEAEEERLAQAIEEARKREEEERLRREEESKLKIEREEAERKARDEAEKQKIETAERLKKEEKEREERRKRVEAIMARTRAKTNKNDSQNNDIDKSTNDLNNSEIITNNSNSIVDQSNNIELNHQNKDRMTSYEKSVTEKENSLLGSFNNKNFDNFNNAVIIDNIQLVSQENGKLLTDINNTSELFIENKNGHQDFSINNIKIIDTVIDGKTEQLIDFNSAPHSIEEFNNKSNNNTPTLVTSDSQENRDLSFV